MLATSLKLQNPDYIIQNIRDKYGGWRKSLQGRFDSVLKLYHFSIRVEWSFQWAGWDVGSGRRTKRGLCLLVESCLEARDWLYTSLCWLQVLPEMAWTIPHMPDVQVVLEHYREEHVAKLMAWWWTLREFGLPETLSRGNCYGVLLMCNDKRHNNPRCLPLTFKLNTTQGWSSSSKRGTRVRTVNADLPYI